jgi:2,6-dihydroxypyridine 3-monooxygenase
MSVVSCLNVRSIASRPSASHNLSTDSRWPRVGIVGGSLGGLTAALVLRDLGCVVTVHERATSELEARGAGIVVLSETSRYLRERTNVPLESITCSTRFLRYLDRRGTVIFEAERPYHYSGWRTIYAALLGQFGRDCYRLGSEVSRFRQIGGAVDLAFSNATREQVDLLVCADGIASRARRALLPDVEPHYAGYVAWRGTVAESDLDASTLAEFADALVYQLIPSSHILIYPIPNADGGTDLGRRLLNFVWYRNYAEGEALNALMTDKDGTMRERTLPPGAVRLEHVEEAQRFARANLAPPIADLVAACAAPFVQAIVDIEVPRMVFDNICLIGDAAFAIRPHIAAGTAKAAADAWALADALATTRGAVGPALAKFEQRQLEIGRHALDRARRNGNRSQFEGKWDPADPSLAFGLSDALSRSSVSV